MKNIRDIIERKPWIGWLLFFLTAAIVFVLGLFASSVMERRTEALFLNQQRLKVDALEPRHEIWGINYPRQYESYLNTRDTTFKSKYNGADKQDMLKSYPNLVVLWAGYLFSTEYNKARGHYYAIDDIRNTIRTGAPMTPDQGPQPGTCWTCKSSEVPRLMNQIGLEKFYGSSWAAHGDKISTFMGCADCHDEKTMSLKITRPALVEAFSRRGQDVNRSTHQEMRNLVCAQCHVEYYFNKEYPHKGVPYLTFPWDNGLNIEAMEAYYDSIQFVDWTHQLSRAPMLKAQHPDYELYTTGIHARRGVTCADCHMPYRAEGGVKFTDHHLQSPLNNVAGSCQVCHRQSESELIASVYSNQDKVEEARLKAEEALAKLHIEAKYAWDLGATPEQMKDILTGIRYAQWRWDFSAASHGASAHAPAECLRLLSSSVNLAQETRIKLAHVLSMLGHQGPVPLPDISTKEKAQAYLGLPMEKMISEKQQFIDQVIPGWVQAAEKRMASDAQRN